MIKPAVVRTLIVPAESAYYAAAHKAGQTYAQLNVKDTMKSIPPHLHIWHSVIQQLADDNSAPPEIKSEAATMLQKISSISDWGPAVYVCRFSKCYDSKYVKAEFAVDVKLHDFLTHLSSLLVLKGGHVCFGPAARNPLERIVSSAVSGLMAD
jgi:hypothetical protein